MPAETYRVATPAEESIVAPAPESAREPRQTPQARQPAEAPVRRRKGWDIALAVVLLLVLVAAVVVAASYGVVFASAADACGSGGRVCREDLRDLGIWMTFTTPLLVLAVVLFFAVVLWVSRRRLFWLPATGLLLLGALWSLGVFLIWAAT
jgi:uncharacterized BrkB/YihY/UPF0761 family membrane protein